MKKLVLTLLAALLVVPAMAADEKPVVPDNKPALTAEQQVRHEAFQKARKEKQEQMKATKEKVEKLVKEYNKLKAGKKKEAKKAEIAAVVNDIHNEQLQFNEKQLAQFEERLNQMRQKAAENSTPEAKKAWVDEKTEALIANEGDLKVLFAHGPNGEKPEMKGHGHHHFKGPRGERNCPCGKEKENCACKGGKGQFKHGPHGMGVPPEFDADGQLPPPPTQE